MVGRMQWPQSPDSLPEGMPGMQGLPLPVLWERGYCKAAENVFFRDQKQQINSIRG